MGWLADVAASVGKKIVPKILIGGDSDDKAAVKTVIDSGAADPVFKKFGKDFETGAKIAGGIATTAVPFLSKLTSTRSGGMLSYAAGPSENSSGPLASSGGEGGNNFPAWVWPVVVIGMAMLFGKKLLQLLR